LTVCKTHNVNGSRRATVGTSYKNLFFMVHKKSQVCVPLPQSVNWLKSVFIKKNRKQYIFIYR